MKCRGPTCPTQRPKAGTQRNLYSTGWHWGFASGETQILCFASGKTQVLAFSDTNMLVSPTQNSGVGGLSQRQGPTQLFCVAVEYRLKSLKQCKTHLYLHMYPDKENTFIFHIRVPTMIMDEHTAISDAIMYRVWKKTVYIEVSRHNS